MPADRRSATLGREPASSLAPATMSVFAEHVENGGHPEGQRLREGARREVHMGVDQAGNTVPPAASTTSSPTWTA